MIYPKIVRQLDIEAELIAVIGKRAYHVEEADALDYVAGYTIINDVSARCLQAQGLLTISKGYETSCPMVLDGRRGTRSGSATALGEDLYQRARGVRRAHIGDAVQHQAVHRIAVASVSARSGDVLATGSPPGPGMYHDPPLLAVPGDTMRVEIESIGVLSNPVVAAQR